MSTTKAVHADHPTGTGREIKEEIDVSFPDGGRNRSIGLVGVLSETVPVASFIDNADATGEYAMVGSLPKGAVVVGTKILVPGAFAGDTTAVVTVGDGTDVDRYMTGTPSVFAALPDGVEAGVPSGDKLLTAENNPVITVTGAADFTSIATDDGGIITVEIMYIEP